MSASGMPSTSPWLEIASRRGVGVGRVAGGGSAGQRWRRILRIHDRTVRGSRPEAAARSASVGSGIRMWASSCGALYIATCLIVNSYDMTIQYRS